jgi:zinc protease
VARRQIAASPLANPAWAGELPVVERALDNGLRVLVLPRPQAPTVVCDLYYPAGSVDDPPGRTGLAHFLEHMLFKGTERFPKGQIDRLTFIAAGQANAETSEDSTHYWFAFPGDRWELALAIEADRMRGVLFDPAEVEAERRVILEERARELDTPQGRLEQTHLAVSYLVHPYRNPVIGWPDDLRRLGAADLRRFYAERYRPDGAVLVVVGGVDPARALDRVEALFGRIEPGAPAIPPPPPPEPPQAGRRAFALDEPEGLPRGLLGWHTVPRGHPDTPALDVLSDLLCCGRGARLWRRLVEHGQHATWVEAMQESAHWAGQFLVQVEAVPRAEPARIEAEIQAVLDELARDGPTPEELARSRRRLEAAWRWEQEDLSGLAAGLGHAALWGDWRAWPAEHRAALDVTADDIRRVATTYLTDANLTAGWARPGRGVVVVPPSLRVHEPAEVPSVSPARSESTEAPLRLAVPTEPARLDAFRPRRALLDNGLRLITERRPGTGVVALDLYCDAGILREAKPGLAHLVARLREEGTRTRGAEALAEAIDDVGGQMEVHSTGVSLRVRAEDLSLAVELLADLFLRPSFPGDRLDWTRRRIAAELAGDRDDPAYRAGLVFLNLIYGDHPFGRDYRGTPRQLSDITYEDICDHQKRFFVPDNGFLIAVGDFEPHRLRALLRTHLGPWLPSGRRLPRLPRLPRSSGPRLRRLVRAGEQVHVLLGHLGIPRRHPDFPALAVLDHILGSGPGFTDRLSRVLRDDLGLAYSVGGGMADTADLAPGALRIYLATGPRDVERAVRAARAQVEALHRGEFGDDEVDHARRYLAGAWVFDYQTVGQRAERLLELERWGLPLDEPLRWPDCIARITPTEVRRAAARHLDPARLIQIEYGPIRRGRRR